MAQRVKLKSSVIRNLLIRRHKSQNWLAMRAGVTSGYMSQLMTGTRFPSPVVTQKLQKAMRVDEFDEIFEIHKV